jgi:hypothetical protein
MQTTALLMFGANIPDQARLSVTVRNVSPSVSYGNDFERRSRWFGLRMTVTFISLHTHSEIRPC